MKNTWPCPGKPEDLKGQPIGMYHCEFCGEMQIAGLPHLEPQFPSEWEEPFPKLPEPTEEELTAPIHQCPSCGSDEIGFTREERPFPYGAPPDTVTLSAIVDLAHCAGCGLEFTDWRAEAAMEAAVAAYRKSKEIP
jgi:hypothetical protein